MRTAFYAFALAALLPGCASMSGSETQQLALSTKGEDGMAVEGVKCKLQNDRGSWEASSPALVKVRRSAEDLKVECRKEGSRDGSLKAVSRVNDMMMGYMVIPGGSIAAMVDHSTGNGYDYPEHLPVEMGKSVLVDRRPPEAAPTK